MGSAQDDRANVGQGVSTMPRACEFGALDASSDTACIYAGLSWVAAGKPARELPLSQVAG